MSARPGSGPSLLIIASVISIVFAFLSGLGGGFLWMLGGGGADKGEVVFLLAGISGFLFWVMVAFAIAGVRQELERLSEVMRR